MRWRVVIQEFHLPAILAALWLLAFQVEAAGCPAFANNHTIFLDADISEIKAPTIVRLTIISPSVPSNSARSFVSGWRYYSWEAFARVDRVIKGTIETPVIKISSQESSCHGPLTSGSGLVAGVIRINAQGVKVLHAISESYGEKMRRWQARRTAKFSE